MSRDLTRHAGFFLEFYEDEVDFDLEVVPSLRLLKALQPVVYDKEWFSGLSEEELNEAVYKMFRDIARPSTRGVFNGKNVRVDLTVIPARSLGVEPVRTLGHFHPLSDDGIPFPEIYQVVWGKALFLEFSPEIKEGVQDFSRIREVNAWQAKTDEFVVLEGGGHITVNLSSWRPLIMLNLVYSRFDSVYEPIQKFGGGPYFYVENEEGDLVFVKNKNYEKVPEVTRRELVEELGPFRQGHPIYKSFLEDPDFYTFLKGEVEEEKEKKKEKQGKEEDSGSEEGEGEEEFEESGEEEGTESED